MRLKAAAATASTAAAAAFSASDATKELRSSVALLLLLPLLLLLFSLLLLQMTLKLCKSLLLLGARLPHAGANPDSLKHVRKLGCAAALWRVQAADGTALWSPIHKSVESTVVEPDAASRVCSHAAAVSAAELGVVAAGGLAAAVATVGIDDTLVNLRGLTSSATDEDITSGLVRHTETWRFGNARCTRCCWCCSGCC